AARKVERPGEDAGERPWPRKLRRITAPACSCNRHRSGTLSETSRPAQAVNLQQLRYLRETVRRDLNLTAAAQVLHTSQPGLSKAIRELEDELGITIFVRHGKRLTALTDAGQEVLAIVERILLEIDNLKRSAANWHDTQT